MEKMPNNEAWYTLYNPHFNTEAYLYHYTSIEKAAMILDGDSLKFSKISKANDTLESKPRVNIENLSKDDIEAIIQHFRTINENYLQILCFSQDQALFPDQVSEKTYYCDYSGRGFALPRMWAQYATNNNGVCLVFDKNLLTELISNTLIGCFIHEGKVEYVPQFDPYQIKPYNLKKLLQLVKKSSNAITTGIDHVAYLKKDACFVQYNYFCKLNDWATEHEYRFLAYGDEEQYIPNIKSALIGVIIGEQTKSYNQKIIQLFCDNNCSVKKVSFMYNGCTLENVYKQEEV